MVLEAHASNVCFEELPQEKAPRNAVVWTSKQYCAMTAWNSLANAEKLQLKPTTFVDKRIRFLEPINDTKPPEEFAKAVSGQYDVKSWRKENCVLSIDGETAVFMKFPHIDAIVTYTAPTRLPTFAKSWKPVVFLVNNTTIAVRLTSKVALIITREGPHSTTMVVNAVNYNKGFICVHPCSSTAFSYGSYAIKSLKDCITIPELCSSCGPWQYLIQFYEWGGLVVPKNLELTKRGGIGSLCGAMGKTDKFGLIIYPPNLFLNLTFSLPSGTVRTLTHGVDFALTAKKISDSDITIYLLLDGQLVQFDYSFDTRINKQENPHLNVSLKFKVTIDKEEKQNALESGTIPKWKFLASKDMKVLVPSGSPMNEIEYLISEQVVAVFDAEIGQYLTHPQGAKLTPVFTKVLSSKSTQTPSGDSNVSTSNSSEPQQAEPYPVTPVDTSEPTAETK